MNVGVESPYQGFPCAPSILQWLRSTTTACTTICSYRLHWSVRSTFVVHFLVVIYTITSSVHLGIHWTLQWCTWDFLFNPRFCVLMFILVTISCTWISFPWVTSSAWKTWFGMQCVQLISNVCCIIYKDKQIRYSRENVLSCLWFIFPNYPLFQFNFLFNAADVSTALLQSYTYTCTFDKMDAAYFGAFVWSLYSEASCMHSLS